VGECVNVRRRLPLLAAPDGPRAPLPAGGWNSGEVKALCAAAEVHGVLPAVLANLRQVGLPAGAAEATRSFRERLLGQAAVAMQLRRQLAEACGALTSRGVEHVVLKGPEFADRLYPEPQFRPFTDIDILIRTDALPVAAAVMRALGYVPEELARRRAYGQQRWMPPEGRPRGDVEIHWDLVNAPGIRRGVSVVLDDLALEGAPSGLRRASPASLLLVAAVHAATSHRFDRLQPLVDIRQAALGAAGTVDEPWLADALDRTGAGLSLHMALHLAGRLLGCQACGAMAGRVRTAWTARVARLSLPAGTVLRRGWGASLRRQVIRELLKVQ